ncbi:MAG: GAF domain-containing protein [Bacillota bacterium]|nr:GAF domain-containing protein [Bacillota bacterium]
MFEINAKKDLYTNLIFELEKLIRFEKNSLANLSNASALLWESLDDINWAGFYIMRTDDLALGPFQGKPACVHITLGSGVCGKSAKEMKPIVVDDVHVFPGHIACDSSSNSEIVVPIIKDNKVIAVIDIDSPTFSRFSENDKIGLENFAETLNKYINWENI